MKKTTIENAKYKELVNWLIKNNLSLAEFGDLLNVTEKHIWGIISGNTEASVKLIDKICKATGLTYIHDEYHDDFVDFDNYINCILGEVYDVTIQILKTRRAELEEWQ